jgi:hypothetical protein
LVIIWLKRWSARPWIERALLSAPVGVGDGVGDAVGVGLAVGDGDGEGDGEAVGVGEAVGLAVGVGVAQFAAAKLELSQLCAAAGCACDASTTKPSVAARAIEAAIVPRCFAMVSGRTECR